LVFLSLFQFFFYFWSSYLFFEVPLPQKFLAGGTSLDPRPPPPCTPPPFSCHLAPLLSGTASVMLSLFFCCCPTPRPEPVPPRNFSKTVPLFPLSSIVLLPAVRHPDYRLGFRLYQVSQVDRSLSSPACLFPLRFVPLAAGLHRRNLFRSGFS